jgi:hypothetical protein
VLKFVFFLRSGFEVRFRGERNDAALH